MITCKHYACLLNMMESKRMAGFCHNWMICTCVYMGSHLNGSKQMKFCACCSFYTMKHDSLRGQWLCCLDYEISMFTSCTDNFSSKASRLFWDLQKYLSFEILQRSRLGKKKYCIAERSQRGKMGEKWELGNFPPKSIIKTGFVKSYRVAYPSASFILFCSSWEI